MKVLTTILAFIMTGAAFAETEIEVRVNRIDMAEVAPDESDDSKATDYNSSRSNKNANKLAVDADSDDSETNGTRATDYNSSRSNKADSIVSDEGSDDDSDEGEPAAKSKD